MTTNATATRDVNQHSEIITTDVPDGNRSEHALKDNTDGCVQSQSNSQSFDSSPGPIAICGIGIRLPGKIYTCNDFWDVLYHGKDVRAPIPPDRFNINAFDGSLGKKNKIDTKHAYCLEEDLEVLDASFFNISKAELNKTDPQLRKTLEVTRECLENAGETGWRGKNIGVYVGTFGDDWLQSSIREGQVSGGYNFAGDLMLANRVSYEFDLHGPSLVIKTGCSASLVALHEACRALLQRDCYAALVSGTSLLMGPHIFKIMTDEGVLSPDGSCKTFDASADGFARAEAINSVFLKRLPDAIRDGNPIRAIIRNSGNNCDGKTQGITSPRADMQESLIRHIYTQARLDPSDTGFFECHGTGTVAGDPIETTAVGNVFGKEGIHIGSVKPNIGHSEGASGLTSLIKAILALEHKTIPPNIKFNTPNPKIDFETHKLVVPLKPTPWPRDRAERISINSFGIGGSNAHVVIDSKEQFFADNPNLARNYATTSSGQELVSPRLLLFSANVADSAKRFAKEVVDYAQRRPELLRDLAYTLASRREKLQYRSYALIAADKTVTETAPIAKASSRERSIIFAFSGQGAQWPQMGLELIVGYPVFSQTINELDDILQALKQPPTWSLRDELLKPKGSSQVHQAELSQPLTTAVQLGIVNILEQLGVTADAVIGHSSGEIAAAYATGILTLHDAIIVSYLRGLTTSSQPSTGGMAVVGLSTKALQPYLVDGVVVAAENSEETTTISGDNITLGQVLESIKADHPDTLARRLQVDMAYHSPRMIPVGEAYLCIMESTFGAAKAWPIPKAANPRMFSTVTAKVISEALDLEYWITNLTSTVKFSPGFSALLAEQAAQPLVIEIGPHSQMAGPIREICKKEGVQSSYVPTIIRGADCLQSIASAVGQLFQKGVEVDTATDSTLFPAGNVLTDMPLYSWDHSVKYWNENRISHDWRFRKHGHHALLGEGIPETNGLEPSWRCMIDLEDEPWLKDHMISTDIVFPFAAFISMAGEAVRQVTETVDFVGYQVKHVVLHTALVLHEDRSTEVALTLRKRKLTDKSHSKYYEFTISSYSGSAWTTHCEGSVVLLTTQKVTANNVKTLPRKVSAAKWYNDMSRIGLRYGPHFQGMTFLEASPVGKHAIAGIAATTVGSFLFHPATMDSAFQLMIAARAKASSVNLALLVVPVLIEEVEVYASSELMIGEASISQDEKRSNLTYTSGSRVCLSMRGVRLAALESEEDADADADKHKAARLEFFPDIDFADHSALIEVPRINRDIRITIEEIVLLCILDSAERVKDLDASQPHYQVYREWLFNEKQKAANHAYGLFQNKAYLFSTLDKAQRQHELNNRLALMTADPVLESLACGIFKINEHCEDLFTGRMDTLNLLLQDNVLTGIYDSMSFDFSKFVRLVCINKPTLRILEVGAGTGGATDIILKSLISLSENPAYRVYTFTDVSAGFFAQATERFSYAPNMEYKVFDISQDPTEQGFQPKGYDIVIANNVIHATPTLKATLVNLRMMLRDGGHLLLSEVCATGVKAPGYVFGQFSGWWMGEADNRKWEPFVSVPRWDRELKSAGFTGAETVLYDEQEPYQHCAAILSQAANSPGMSMDGLKGYTNEIAHGHASGHTMGTFLESGTIHTVTILCDEPEKGPTAAFIVDLKSRGHQVVAVKLGDGPLPPDRPILVTFDMESYFFQDITAPRLLAFQELTRQHQSQKLLWVMPRVQLDCDDPRPAQTLGFMRLVRSELSLPFHTLEIDKSEPAFTDLILQVLGKIINRDDVETLSPDREFVVQNGSVKIPRIQPFSLQKGMEASPASQDDDGVKRLAIGKLGSLETLHWVSTVLNLVAGDEVEIETRAVGINFKDIMMSMGILTLRDGTLPQLGIEMSGIVTRAGSAVHHVKPGDRVIATASDGFFATRAITKGALVVGIPDELGFEEAATIPVVFATVIQALMRTACLEKGKTVLIHSACGGIGHAAVQLCQSFGAEIFVTVGSKAKADYAHTVYGIPENRIFNSRDVSFVADVLRETQGKGVDIVLNSLSGPLLHASWECVAEFGQLVELGKRDLVEFGSLALEPFLLSRSYCYVDLVHMMERRPEKVGQLLRDTVQLLRDGKIKPIASRTDFDAHRVTEAFRHLQKGDHIGKVVLTLPVPGSADADATGAAAAQLIALPKRAKLTLDPGATYLLTGGLGGVGKAVASWMAERGAVNLVFLSRSAGRGREDAAFFAELAMMGCTAIPVRGQVQVLADVERAIAAAPSPIKGVLHLAMVLRDGPVLDLSFEDWTQAVAPKVDGAWNLHHALSKLELPPLDFFLVTSSIVTATHHPGQANYVAANAAIEALVQFRRRQGLPASALGLAAVEDIGFVSKNDGVRRRLKSQGLYFITERLVLDFFEHSLLHQHNSPGTSAPAGKLSSWANHGHTIAGLHSETPLTDPDCLVHWRRNREMGFYHNIQATSSGAMARNTSSALALFIEEAASDGNASKVLDSNAAVEFLAKEIGLHILQLMMREADDGLVDVSLSLAAVGMDSLIAIELRRWWKQSFAVNVTVLEIMAASNLRGLGLLASQALKRKLVG